MQFKTAKLALALVSLNLSVNFQESDNKRPLNILNWSEVDAIRFLSNLSFTNIAKANEIEVITVTGIRQGWGAYDNVVIPSYGARYHFSPQYMAYLSGAAKTKEIDEQEKCEIKATTNKADCVTTANFLGRSGAALCLGFTHPAAIISCEIANATAWDDQLGQCDIQLEIDKARCD